MKFYAIDDKMVSLENVLKITCSEVRSSRHTSQGKPYYAYDCDIRIYYTSTSDWNEISFDWYNSEKEAATAQKKVFNEILEILKD